MTTLLVIWQSLSFVERLAVTAIALAQAGVAAVTYLLTVQIFS